MNLPHVVLSTTYAETDYTITMTRSAWELREKSGKHGQSRAYSSWYKIEELFKCLKENYPNTVYKRLLDQYKEVANRFVQLEGV